MIQRKKYLNFAIGFILLLVLFGLFLVAYNDRHHPSPTTQHQTKNLLVHPVLIVDFNNNDEFTQEDLQKGEDAILVVQNNATNDKNPEWFNSLAALIAYDINQDKRIDKHDSIFPRLALLYYPGQSKQKYISLKNAHVKAIVIDKTKLVKLPTEAKEIPEVVTGHIELNNGETRNIKAVAIKID